MTIRRRNPRLQGLLGLSAAIDWFTRAGYFVAIPLNDSQPWDLVVEDQSGVVSRVQVKTTTTKNQHGKYVASLETAGGNKSVHTRKPFDKASCELLFVLTDDGNMYLMPTAIISARRAISLCTKYERFLVTGPQQLVVGGGFEPP
ncbi:MAG TPA: group I intron-associated PD-(D/E)XK endonuclease [Egibacteraceae bacterium]|nr:group I intron-associated PD-(D/E)XK endonuclease [Egibacteraceae bacterium]